MVALVFMCIAIAGALGLLSYGIYRAVKLVKSPTPRANNYPLETKKFVYFCSAISFVTLLVFVLLSIYHKYSMNAGEWIELILGSLIFGFSLPAAIYAFIVHYYGKEIPERLNKWLFKSVLIGFISAGIGLLLLTNGIADYVDYPLVNGLSFKEGFTYPGGTKPSIAWYAICILSGAVLVYFVCDHRFYVEYGKHGILESTFLVAFPAGIIGARIGYVIGNWSRTAEGLSFAQRVANGEWWSPLAIWEGGLTIISGALVGIIVGVLWFIWRNKKYSIWLAVDIIVPTILIAQAIGRWGNFFNAEVHGLEVSASGFWWLPRMVFNNAAFSEKLGPASAGNIYLPLFYIEFLTNLLGYFFIRFALGKGLRKYLQLGDLCFSYIVWYGLTRSIMEPFRHPHYNMGDKNFYSWIWAMVFVVAGSFAIFMNHLIRYLINRKKVSYKESNALSSSITSGVLVAVSIALIVVGAIYMGGVRTNTMMFDDFNTGLLLLILGLGMLCYAGCALIYLVQGLKRKMKQYKTLLFDMDGTVIDTDPLLRESFHILYDKYRNGVYTPQEEIWYFSGPPIKKTLAREFPNLDLQFIFEEFNKVSEKLYPTHTFKYDDSREVLLELKKAGYQLGIVTNKVHRLAVYALECVGLDSIFDIIIGYEDVKNPKPDAEGILKAISLFNSSQESTLYVGDNASDLLSANNAEVDCCLVKWGPRKLDPNLKPTFTITSYLDLKEKLLYGKGI